MCHDSWVAGSRGITIAGWLGLSPLVTLYTRCLKMFRIKLVGIFVLLVHKNTHRLWNSNNLLSLYGTPSPILTKLTINNLLTIKLQKIHFHINIEIHSTFLRAKFPILVYEIQMIGKHPIKKHFFRSLTDNLTKSPSIILEESMRKSWIFLDQINRQCDLKSTAVARRIRPTNM